MDTPDDAIVSKPALAGPGLAEVQERPDPVAPAADAGRPDTLPGSTPGIVPPGIASPGIALPVEPAADPAGATTAPLTPLRLIGFAGLSGALAAAVVALLVSVFPLRSNDDPRTLQLIHDVAELTARVQTLTDRTRTVETEDVATSQTINAIDHRLASTTGELDSLRTALGTLTAEQRQAATAMAGVNAPALFGVAAVQLRDRVEAGLPFDWELVNLRGIAGKDPTLLAELDRLAPLAASGVVTQPRLVEAMQVLLAREGPRSSLVEAGIGVFSSVLGPNLVSPPGNDPVVLTRAMARLSAGDLANFLREMQGLSVSTAGSARPLVLAAQHRLVALTAAQALLRTARTGLESQLKSATTTSVAPRP